MKIFYWSPFLSNIATVDAVAKSVKSILTYDKYNKFKPSIVFGIKPLIYIFIFYNVIVNYLNYAPNLMCIMVIIYFCTEVFYFKTTLVYLF